MRYARQRLENDERDRAYRFFITEEIRVISQAMASFFGGEGINKNLYDFFDEIDAKKRGAGKYRTGEEIKEYVKNGLRKLADRK